MLILNLSSWIETVKSQERINARRAQAKAREKAKNENQKGTNSSLPSFEGTKKNII